MPAVRDLWSYGETGFHALSAAVVKERYPREALASAFRILGEGQSRFLYRRKFRSIGEIAHLELRSEHLREFLRLMRVASGKEKLAHESK